jgi:hypothetical protein
MVTRGPIGGVLAAIVVLTMIAASQGGSVFGQSRSSDDAAVRRVLDDYIGLYRKDTLERWKTLFVSGFTATYTNDDGSVTTRTLDDFYERQRSGFERGAMNETIQNPRVTRAGKLAHVFTDFVFTSGGAAPRHGQLMLLLIEEKGQFKIAALTFTYHLQ